MDDYLLGIVPESCKKRLNKYRYGIFPVIYGGMNMEMDIKEEHIKRAAKLKKMRSAVITARPS